MLPFHCRRLGPQVDGSDRADNFPDTGGKPEAKRFKRWVTHDVLPAIRRTGGYAVPGLATIPAPLPADKQDSVSALLLIGQAVAQVPGVKPGIAMAATLTCIQENTGLATETLRRALPAAAEPIYTSRRSSWQPWELEA